MNKKLSRLKKEQLVEIIENIADYVEECEICKYFNTDSSKHPCNQCRHLSTVINIDKPNYFELDYKQFLSE